MHEQLISQLHDYFCQKPVIRAYVFGSYARNTQHSDSDIDLLVELDYANGADFFGFLQMQRELPQLINKRVDLVSANGLSPYIKPFIDQEKILLYENTAR